MAMWDSVVCLHKMTVYMESTLYFVPFYHWCFRETTWHEYLAGGSGWSTSVRDSDLTLWLFKMASEFASRHGWLSKVAMLENASLTCYKQKGSNRTPMGREFISHQQKGRQVLESWHGTFLNPSVWLIGWLAMLVSSNTHLYSEAY